MTTLAERRAELTTAMAAGGVTISDAPGRVQPPVGYIFGDGSDLTGVIRGQVPMNFRLSLVAGKADAPAASASLGELTGLALGALRELPGWKLGELRPDRVVTIAGGDYLAADLTASAMVDVQLGLRTFGPWPTDFQVTVAGVPLAGALIVITSIATGLDVLAGATDASGRVTIFVPTGSYYVRTSKLPTIPETYYVDPNVPGVPLAYNAAGAGGFPLAL